MEWRPALEPSPGSQTSHPWYNCGRGVSGLARGTCVCRLLQFFVFFPPFFLLIVLASLLTRRRSRLEIHPRPQDDSVSSPSHCDSSINNSFQVCLFLLLLLPHLAPCRRLSSATCAWDMIAGWQKLFLQLFFLASSSISGHTHVTL